MKLYEAFREKSKEIGELLVVKNKAYGNSFNTSGEILRVLYPEGVKPDQYEDLLSVARIIDKLYRISNKKNGKDQMGESPYEDLAGYSILGAVRDMGITEEEQ